MAASCHACDAAIAPGQAFCRQCGVKLAVPTDPLIGRTLGQYHLESEIARGGMGVVYHAFDERLERSVALKLLRHELAEDPSFRARFVRESRAAAGLDHPSILPVFDAGEIDGALYIATRLVDGVDLRGFLDRFGTLDPDRALSIVGQVAAALDYAHQRGIVHRDVKPANILLTSDQDAVDHAYLIDFGITASNSTDTRLTATGRFLGTPEYVAPEQINAQALDGRADQYALACVLYHCLTGTAPFQASATVDILHAHLHEPPPRPSTSRADVSPALDDALARALSKNPARRFETCRAFVATARLRGAAPPPSTADERPTGTIVARAPRAPTVHSAAVAAPTAPARSRGARIAAGAALLAVLAAGGVAAGALLSKGDKPQADAATNHPRGNAAKQSAKKQGATGAARTAKGSSSSTAAANPAARHRLDPAALSLTKRAFADYTADLPSNWSLDKRDEPQVAAAPARRTRTELVNRAIGASVVIDKLEHFDVPPQENRATLDRAYARVKPNYRRVGFDDYALNGTTAYEWRFRYSGDNGREVRRVDVMIRLGSLDFAVRSGGALSYDTLAQLARQTAQSITLTSRAATASDTTAIPAPGVYTGTGIQRSADSGTETELAIRMAFSSSGSTVDYPTLGCTGTLVPDGFSGGDRIYREQITSGSCDRDGRWAVTVLADAALQAQWTLPSGKYTVSARLTR